MATVLMHPEDTELSNVQRTMLKTGLCSSSPSSTSARWCGPCCLCQASRQVFDVSYLGSLLASDVQLKSYYGILSASLNLQCTCCSWAIPKQQMNWSADPHAQGAGGRNTSSHCTQTISLGVRWWQCLHSELCISRSICLKSRAYMQLANCWRWLVDVFYHLKCCKKNKTINHGLWLASFQLLAQFR